MEVPGDRRTGVEVSRTEIGNQLQHQRGFVIKDNGDNSNNRKFLATSTDILGLILNRSPSGESGSFE